MNYEVTIPGERVPYREFVYRVPIQREIMPWHPFDPAILGPTYEEIARAVVSVQDGRIEVRLLPTEYTLAKEPRVILRGEGWSLPRHELDAVLTMALSNPCNTQEPSK